MKKLLVVFAAVIAVSFASCAGGNTQANETDSTACEACPDSCCVEEVVEDTASVDTTVVVAE